MPRYNFHSVDGCNPAGNADGREIANDEVAIEEARNAALDALQECVSGQESARVVVTVSHSDGSGLATVTILALVERNNSTPSER